MTTRQRGQRACRPSNVAGTRSREEQDGQAISTFSGTATGSASGAGTGAGTAAGAVNRSGGAGAGVGRAGSAPPPRP